MNYQSLLKRLDELEGPKDLSREFQPQLHLVVNNDQSLRDRSDAGTARGADRPLSDERSIEEVTRRQVAAHDNIRRRLAGHIEGMPLSTEDAAVYRRLIDERAERLISQIRNASRDLSVLSVAGQPVNPKIDIR